MTKKCIGCGVELQNTDKNLQGYTPKPIDTKEDMYCQRCFQLKHYGKYSTNKMTREDYKKEVGKLLDLKSIGLLDVYGNLCKKEIL